jgi:GNAT superfamily N-acetyltransferase
MFLFYEEWETSASGAFPLRSCGWLLDSTQRSRIALDMRALMTTATWQITPVETSEALAAVRLLLDEYWNSFGFTPCFQNFGEELAGLPGAYAPPGGRLALATVDEQSAGVQPAGCIALRRVDADRAEAKRLYVRAAFRGLGLGRALMEWVMAEARAAGYREIVGDTMPVMHDALALYERMGFERTGTGPKVQASTFPQVSEEPILIRIRL